MQIMILRKSIKKVFYGHGDEKMEKFIKEWGPYLIIIVAVILVRTYIVTPVVVRGDSMYDTLRDGEVLFLGKINYRFHEIQRFDIVVIKDLDGDAIIKRVIGLPGDNIEYKDDVLYINGKAYDKRFTSDVTEDFTLEEICQIHEIGCVDKIPDDMYLVLGDNRDVSADSRVKGLIKRSQIKGKAIFRLWPLNKIGIL